jgi:putative peptidoglycan lipid II flippase
MLFTDQLVSVIAPGFPAATHDTTVRLLRIMLPAFFFAMLTDLAIAILHSFRVFGIPSISRLIVPLLSLLLVLTAAERYGIVVLAVGTLLGATVQIMLIFRALFRSGFRYTPALSFRDADVRRVLSLVAPFALSVLAAQGAGVVYRILVSHFPEGSLSVLKFGEKIFQMTNTLFLSSITTVVFPALSRAVAERAWEETRKTMRQAVRLMVFFGVPLTVGMMFLREPLVRLLYERGSFTAEDTAVTAAVLGLLLLGLVANGIGSLLGHLALALKATRISVFATIGTQLASILLFFLLASRLGIRGFALASAISPFILVALYMVLLRKQVARVWNILADPTLLKFIVSGVALSVGVAVGTRLTGGGGDHSLPDIVILTVSAGLGSLAYIGSAWALGIPEIRIVREIVYYALRRFRQ